MRRPLGAIAVLVMCSSLFVGCSGDMRDQPRYDPYEPSEFFPHGQSALSPVEGTVARGTLVHAQEKSARADLTLERLERGRQRYDIYCSPCHDRSGSGNGVIVRRGFPRPPTFHQERLREVSDAYVVQVISAGFGAMYPYGSRIDPDDRWAIAGYVRALQLSQAAPVDVLSPGLRAALGSMP